MPLTIGGGIRAYTDSDGNKVSGLDVASRYFRAGADKVSLGSDAVEAVKGFIANGRQPTAPLCFGAAGLTSGTGAAGLTSGTGTAELTRRTTDR